MNAADARPRMITTAVLWQTVIWTHGRLPRQQRTKPRAEKARYAADKDSGPHGLFSNLNEAITGISITRYQNQPVNTYGLLFRKTMLNSDGEQEHHGENNYPNWQSIVWVR